MIAQFQLRIYDTKVTIIKQYCQCTMCQKKKMNANASTNTPLAGTYRTHEHSKTIENGCIIVKNISGVNE